MYRYYRTTGQSELNLFGFVTGHLLHMDGMSDKTIHHDTQKPHSSPPKHHPHVKILGLVVFPHPPGLHYHFQAERAEVFTSDFYVSDYISDIFHPPTI